MRTNEEVHQYDAHWSQFNFVQWRALVYQQQVIILLQFLVALIIEFLANAGCIARVEFVSMLLISLHFVCTAVLCTVYY